MVKTNARWAGYLFIALGLINWRYQDSNPNAMTNSLILIAGGVITLFWHSLKLALLGLKHKQENRLA
jgi:hypothetical protein